MKQAAEGSWGKSFPSGNTPGRGGAIARLLLRALVLAGCFLLVPAAKGQEPANPVYLHDSPVALESLQGLDGQIAAGNLQAAVRVLQKLLDEEGDRVVPAIGQIDLFISVRERVHQALRADAALLERYRRQNEGLARELLERGDAASIARVENSYLLTTAGFDAAMLIAAEHLEAGRFEAALRTLIQLDEHPDRRGDRANAAADLLRRLAPYLDRADVWERTRRWGSLGITEEPEPAVEWPAVARVRGLSPLAAAEAVSLDGLVSKSLWSARLGGGGPAPNSFDYEQSGSVIPLFGRDLRLLPTVSGETVYVNDGEEISAWDRFTLTRRWTFDPTGGSSGPPNAPPRGRASRAEDASTVTVAGRLAAAATGLPISGGRHGDGRVHLLDAASGSHKWSARVENLDPQLAGSSVRGPVILGEGVAVVAMRKANPARRLVSLYLVGLNLRDGSLAWRQLVGTAGSLPFGSLPVMVDGASLHHGVVYRGDALGVIGAYEAHTGRPVWVRRFDSQPSTPGMEARPFEMNVPVVHGDSIYTISPDRAEVLRLGLESGFVLGRRASDRFGTPSPQYVVKVGDNLAAVSDARIGVVGIDELETGTVRLTDRVAEPGIRGRVSAAGDSLLVPTVSGVAVLNGAEPEAPATFVPLDSPGNVLALASQLVVVDDARLHTYLLWEAAERVLSERMAADPMDATPAAVYAELAYRADRQELILTAVDAAIEAIDKRPEPNDGARQRLFEALIGMATASQEIAAQTPEAALPRAVRGIEAVPIRDVRMLGELIARAGRLAATPDDRVAHLLAEGRYLERALDLAGAVAVYQRILADESLRVATWNGTESSLRAELEATWRLEQIVEQHGAAVYGAIELTAAAEAEALGEGAEAEQIAAIARRYPVAAVTPGLYLRLATDLAARGRAHSAVDALEAGLRAARSRPDIDSAVVGELGGRLVRALQARGQVTAAAHVLSGLSRAYPGLELRDDEAAISMEGTLAELAALRAQRERWPAIGEVTGDNLEVHLGWSLLRPQARSMVGGTARCLVMENGEEVAVMAPGEGGTLIPFWRETLDTRSVDLLRIEGDGALLYYSGGQGGVMEFVSVERKASQWRTVPFPLLFRSERAGQPAPGVNPRNEPMIQTPQDGMGGLTDLVFSLDEQTITLVERSGRAAAIDAATGETLWALRTPFARVYDTDLSAGTLTIAGDIETMASGVAVRTDAAIVTMDARTGQVMQRILPERAKQVRWLRSSPGGGGGAVIIGMDSGVMSLDPVTGQVNWRLRNLEQSQDAWIFGDRLFVLGASRELWMVNAATGTMHPRSLEVPPEHLAEYQPLYASLLSGPGGEGGAEADAGRLMAISTLSGVVLLDPEGEVVGADALGNETQVVPALPASDCLVTVETGAANHEADGRMAFNIHVLDAQSAQLRQTIPILLGARPRRLALLDGRVAITAGNSTIVLRADEATKP